VSSAPALALNGVRKTFASGTANEVRALQGIDLEVAPGSFVIVIGSNGSGKSSLLGAIAGSFPVDAGRIRVGTRDVTSWPEHRRARILGRVFQDPFAGTSPELSVAENLALASARGRRRGLGWALGVRLRREIGERVRELGMGLEDRLEQPIGALSGGQRQALTLLMATWRPPEILLLDEPTAALDPRSADQIVRLSETVIARERLTALVVTHSMQQAVSLGDRLLMLDRGRVLHDLGGAEKLRLRVGDLLARFEEVRRSERLDESAAELLRRVYV
jgi:putative ABC transport system ATP-binding protein